MIYVNDRMSFISQYFWGIPLGKVSLERVFIFCFVEPFKHIIVVSEVLATILGFRCMVIKMLRIYFSSRFSEKLKGKDTLWVHHTPSFENLWLQSQLLKGDLPRFNSSSLFHQDQTLGQLIHKNLCYSYFPVI